jgi:polyisoprenyl-teichoic acid--peptidoglycan teichoic acid transferase
MAVLARTTRSTRTRPNSRRRKLFAAVLIAVLAVSVVGGVYAWRMVDAIVNAERTAVYPLPPRDNEIAVQVSPTSTAHTETTTTPAGPGGVLTPPATTVNVSSGRSRTDPTPTPPNRALPTGDDPSRMSVVQDLIGASVGSGDPGKSQVWGGKSAITLMVLGVDTRPNGGDQNADVIIIANVDLINRKVAAVSIPRDLLVEIPGVGQGKINGAYNYGVKADPTSKVAGVAKMRDTLESVFGVYIDGYIMVDFNGFTDVIDAMGGVTIDVPNEIVDDQYPTDNYGTEVVRFTPGRQLMDGERALKYVRTRHQDSDDGRRERQLQVLRALFEQAKSFDSISNGFEIITALGGSVQTSFYLDQQLTLAQLGYAMDDGDIQLSSLTAPLIWGGYTDGGAWVYYSDPVAVRDWVTKSLSTNFTTATPVPGGAIPIATPS